MTAKPRSGDRAPSRAKLGFGILSSILLALGAAQASAAAFGGDAVPAHGEAR